MIVTLVFFCLQKIKVCKEYSSRIKRIRKDIRFFSYTKNVKFGKGGKTGTKMRYYSIEYFHRKLIVHFVKQQQKFFDLNNLALLNFTLAANMGQKGGMVIVFLKYLKNSKLPYHQKIMENTYLTMLS